MDLGEPPVCADAPLPIPLDSAANTLPISLYETVGGYRGLCWRVRGVTADQSQFSQVNRGAGCHG